VKIIYIALAFVLMGGFLPQTADAKGRGHDGRVTDTDTYYPYKRGLEPAVTREFQRQRCGRSRENAVKNRHRGNMVPGC
jgi:hypothetical protein